MPLNVWLDGLALAFALRVIAAVNNGTYNAQHDHGTFVTNFLLPERAYV